MPSPHPPHSPFWLFFLWVRPGGEEVGVVCNYPGSRISQNQALLTVSCVTRPRNLPPQSIRFLICKVEMIVGCVAQGWEEVNKITEEKSRARCLAQRGGRTNISRYSYYWHVTHIFYSTARNFFHHLKPTTSHRRHQETARGSGGHC